MSLSRFRVYVFRRMFLLGIHLWVRMLCHRLCTYLSVLHTVKRLYQVIVPPAVYESSSYSTPLPNLLFIMCCFIFVCILILKSRTEPLGLRDKHWGIIEFIATVIIPWLLVYASDSEWSRIELRILLNRWQNQSHCVQWKILQQFAFSTCEVMAFSSQQW